VPESFADQATIGGRVEVVLGKNKKYAGIIKNLHTIKPTGFDPKDIGNILDAVPVVQEKQLKLWEWIAQYYMCSEGEVMAAALPAHFKLSSETVLQFNEEYGEDFSALDENEFIVGEALLIRKELGITEVQELLDSNHVYPVIKKLIEKKVCFVWESLKETYRTKKETYIVLNPEYENDEKLSELLNNWSRAPRQMELLLAYLHLMKTEGAVTKTALLKKSSATDVQLKGLEEKNIVRLEKRNIDRIQFLPRDIQIDFILTDAQQTIFDDIIKQLVQKQVCLLHGVTSSGKTMVYINLLEKYIRQGKQALYLLPEIALTSQIIRRLQKHFGGYIGIYHSKFSQNERVEIWNKVKSGELKIVLGARSSLFLPFQNLGLLIIDEEQDASYKQQEPAPRYHARDAAVFYASLFEAKVVMGSATPSIESYYNTQTGKYGLVSLNERYGRVNLPEIELIDTSKMVNPDRSKVMITPVMEKSIDNTLREKKQVILFQNRRGYSPYQVCQMCGWIPHCKFCDVSLNHHKNTHKLHCHYCGTVYPLVTVCQACGSDRFLQRNFGTERIEEQLQDIFPEANIARMDIDSVKGKQAHDNLIQLFEQSKLDILVGTQMVVKGLDFDNVNLVGILDADSLLGFADFRVNERAFQLMEQVSGRAGRKDGNGKVLIQVINTGHPVLKFVREHNFQALYQHEIESRKRFFYPPFSRIIQITFRHKIKDIVDGAARHFANNLTKNFSKYISGPAEPVVNRVRNQYLMEIMLKLPKDTSFLSLCKNAIREYTSLLHNDKRFRSVIVIVDVDSV